MYQPQCLGTVLAVFAPGRECCHQATIHMGGIDTGMATDFFEINIIDSALGFQEAVQRLLEAQETHSTALKALRLERLHTGHYPPCCRLYGPSRSCA